MPKQSKTSNRRTSDLIARIGLFTAVAIVSILYLIGFVKEMRGKSKAPDWKDYVHVKGQIQPGLKVPAKVEEAH